MTERLVCPHRRWKREATCYRCIDCGETMALGEPETEPVMTWADNAKDMKTATARKETP